jgi:hypothetical protein
MIRRHLSQTEDIDMLGKEKMLNKKEMLSPNQVQALKQLRTEMTKWFFSTTWATTGSSSAPYSVFLSEHGDDLDLIGDELTDCGWNWSKIGQDTLRISLDTGNKLEPSSDILPTPAEVQLFCQNHEIVRTIINNMDLDPEISSCEPINLLEQTPKRVITALLDQLKDLGWIVSQSGDEKIWVRYPQS